MVPNCNIAKILRTLHTKCIRDLIHFIELHLFMSPTINKNTTGSESRYYTTSIVHLNINFTEERTIEENSPSTALNPSSAIINKEHKLRLFILHITNYPHNCNLNKIQNSKKPIIRKRKKWMQLSVSIKPTVLTSAPSMLALDSSLLDNSLNCLTVIGIKVRTLRFCTKNLFINTYTHVHTRNDENLQKWSFLFN